MVVVNRGADGCTSGSAIVRLELDLLCGLPSIPLRDLTPKLVMPRCPTCERDDRLVKALIARPDLTEVAACRVS